MEVFVAGIPSSLAPRTHFSPAFSLPFPFPVYACYAGYLSANYSCGLLQLRLESDWSQNNKHSRNNFRRSWFNGFDCNCKLFIMYMYSVSNCIIFWGHLFLPFSSERERRVIVTVTMANHWWVLDIVYLKWMASVHIPGTLSSLLGLAVIGSYSTGLGDSRCIWERNKNFSHFLTVF